MTFHFLPLSLGKKDDGPSLIPPFSIIIDVSDAPLQEPHAHTNTDTTPT